MNFVLEKILKTGYTESPKGSLVKVHSAISYKEGEFLQKVISELRPTVTLEIGLAYGISALFICNALEKSPNARHIIVDPHQHRSSWLGIGLYNLRKAGYGDIVEFYNLPSYQALPQLEAKGRKIDFAFIDGWHTFDYTLVDFFYIDKMLKVGGLVVFDDACWQSVRKVCRYIITNLSYSVFRCLKPTNSRKSLIKHILFDKLLRVTKHSKIIQKLLKPKFIESDIELGLYGSCIALRKESEDTRSWNHHTHF